MADRVQRIADQMFGEVYQQASRDLIGYVAIPPVSAASPSASPGAVGVPPPPLAAPSSEDAPAYTVRADGTVVVEDCARCWY